MRESPKEQILGGLTRYEFIRQRASALIRQDSGEHCKIHEAFVMDRTYAYGIGLYAVIDVPHLDVSTINAFIERFRAMGEQPWKSVTPVPRDHLPSDTLEVLWQANQTKPS